jgi:S-DNA-T family DNA segregation ATPase FtsK/SpoIIIE
MLENRSLKADLFALALLVVVIFLGFAVFTYNPADPVGASLGPLDGLYTPDLVVFPLSSEVSNACGRWGALAADLLLTAFGVGAYYLVISLGALDYQLLRRSQIDTPFIRIAGWVITLLGLTTLCAMVLPGFSPGPVIGSGGYFGALGKGLLQMHFATTGSLILAISLLLGGLLLCTDYAVFRLGFQTFSAAYVSGTSLARLIPWPRRLGGRRGRGRLLEEGLDDDEGPVRVRFRGPRGDIADDEFADLDEDSEDEEEESAGADATRAQPTALARRENVWADAAHDESSLRVRRPPDKSERERVIASLNEASRGGENSDYRLPPIDLLLPGEMFNFDEQEREVRRKAKVLEKTFADFGFKVKVVEIETGPVIAQYEVELEAGLRLSKITGLADDLAIALRVPSVRIVAPIPGKNTVGIEVPNEQRQVVRLREVIEETDGRAGKMRVPLFLGKDVSGDPLVVDLSTLPHLLIAGRTGTGKSVCLNAIIASILMTRRPDEVRLLMIDPKRVELSGYARLPHLMHPVVTDMRKAEAILAWAVEKMEERYALLARAGVRHISSYNQLDEDELISRLQPETAEERQSIPLHLPFIVIVADEIADLMMTAGKEVEQHIIRLAQKSRAVGIHLILATQKPTVDVITGLIKSNLPARISFQVASRTDSRVVLDEMGADKLLGNGDMLFLWPGTSALLRGQGTYLNDEEIDRVVEFVSTDEQNFVPELLSMKLGAAGGSPEPGQLKKRDELYESAVDIVVREGRGSVSLLQRALGIGYGRAARLIDFMAEDGIVGPYNGSQAREVAISLTDWEQMQGQEPNGVTRPPDGDHRRPHRVTLRGQDDALEEVRDPYDGTDYQDDDPQVTSSFSR